MPTIAEADNRVRQTHLLIERQRRLMEQLQESDRDSTSAEIVFESLLISLSLSVQDRHRLRIMLNIENAVAA